MLFPRLQISSKIAMKSQTYCLKMSNDFSFFTLKKCFQGMQVFSCVHENCLYWGVQTGRLQKYPQRRLRSSVRIIQISSKMAMKSQTYYLKMSNNFSFFTLKKVFSRYAGIQLCSWKLSLLRWSDWTIKQNYLQRRLSSSVRIICCH